MDKDIRKDSVDAFKEQGSPKFAGDASYPVREDSHTRPATEFFYDDQGRVVAARRVRPPRWDFKGVFDALLSGLLQAGATLLLILLVLLFFDVTREGRIVLRGESGNSTPAISAPADTPGATGNNDNNEAGKKEASGEKEQLAERLNSYLGALALMAGGAESPEAGQAAKVILGSPELSVLYVALAEEEHAKGTEFPKAVTNSILGTLGLVQESRETPVPQDSLTDANEEAQGITPARETKESVKGELSAVPNADTPVFTASGTHSDASQKGASGTVVLSPLPVGDDVPIKFSPLGRGPAKPDADAEYFLFVIVAVAITGLILAVIMLVSGDAGKRLR